MTQRPLLAVGFSIGSGVRPAVYQLFAPDQHPPASLRISTLAVVLCVVAHYESLSFLSGFLRRVQLPPQPRILLLIFSILAILVVEIWIFGGAFYGSTVGAGSGTLLAGTEALTGFVLLTWSASFTSVELQRFWKA